MGKHRVLYLKITLCSENEIQDVKMFQFKNEIFIQSGE